ncbi:MAG: hypothetical protein IK103_01445 [Bacteroidales bacterium]|nr:hypothetical protein [Bacteroidales bacterium]
MKKIVVSDTNIFIDLVKLGLLDNFFMLPWEIHTTDFVISELTDSTQKAALNVFIKQKKLSVGTLSSEDVKEMLELSNQSPRNISITDISVCIYARNNGYMLLTGDKQLRKVAIAENIIVHGILFLFDELVSHSILTPGQAAETLIELKRINTRLPIEDVNERINMWLTKSKEKQ